MADKRLRLLGTVWTRWEKNEDGDKVKTKYRTGDEVVVREGQAKRLLDLEVGGRHVFGEYKEEQEKAREAQETRTASPKQVSTEK